MDISIGEFARLHHVSVQTLRHYDKIGLLKPARIDPISRYRYYDESSLATLWKIKALRSLNVSLPEIKTIIHGNTDKTKKILETTRCELQHKIKSYQEMLRCINDTLNMMALSETDGWIVTQPECQSLPARKGHVLPVNDDFSLLERIRLLESFNTTIDGYIDVVFQPARKSVIKDGQIELEAYLAIYRDDQFDDGEVILPEGKYLTLDCLGSVDNVPRAYRRLFEYAAQNGYSYLPWSIELLLIDGRITSDANEFVRRIQLAIV